MLSEGIRCFLSANFIAMGCTFGVLPIAIDNSLEEGDDALSQQSNTEIHFIQPHLHWFNTPSTNPCGGEKLSYRRDDDPSG